MELANLWIPRRLRGFDDGRPETQAYDVVLAEGRLASIRAADGAATGTLLPAFVDAHVHLDKTFTVSQVGPAQGDLFAAITRMAEHRKRWTADDLRARMTKALEEAWRCGTRAIRTHLDWPEPKAPVSLGVFQQLCGEWAGRIELQFTSLTPLDVIADPVAGETIAQQVQEAGGALGAFIYRNADLDAKVATLLALAAKHGLPLDIHVDEGLHADATGLRRIAEQAPAAGLAGRITCSHCCSLSVQPAEEARRTLALCAQAGVHLIGLPTTNLYLQGAWDGTPVERGITRLREASDEGLRGSLASDNVADAFYPYGSYDLLETFALGVQLAHLAPAADWLDTITASPARAMGLAWDGLLREGAPADLVQLEARDEFELLMPPGRRRTVIRQGRPLGAA